MKISEYKEIATKIKEIYKEVDNKNTQFSKKYNIACSTTCLGVCCKDKNVSVSPIDLIPLALDIIENGQEQEMLAKLKESKNEGCVFFKNGRCSVYENRAMLCRGFGYSQLRDKNKKAVLSVCSEISKNYSHPIAKHNAHEALNLVDSCTQIKQLKPEWGHLELPFNQSLQFCLENILNSYYYE